MHNKNLFISCILQLQFVQLYWKFNIVLFLNMHATMLYTGKTEEYQVDAAFTTDDDLDEHLLDFP